MATVSTSYRFQSAFLVHDEDAERRGQCVVDSDGLSAEQHGATPTPDVALRRVSTEQYCRTANTLLKS